MIELIKSSMGVIGVIIGWGLNTLTTAFRERAKICFRMIPISDNELTEQKNCVEENVSKFGIEILNVGTTPFVLNNFLIYYKKKLLVNCRMPENHQIILPFHSTTYFLSKQEIDSLINHYQKENFETCRIMAYSADQKKAKGMLILDAPRFAIRTVKVESNLED